MTEVVSVQFRGRGKSYFFDPAGITASRGDLLVVETSKGLELGECTQGNHAVEDSAVVQPLRSVVRAATGDDRRVSEINRRREKEAFGIAEEKIAKHKLEMKLVDVECSFEGNKILFFFTADGRVDFRELVKDLAGVFRTRIELRQIGVRDEAKMLGGIGICGQPFCCSRFLTDFQPVSTKMAKTQSMSLNPAKISGCCGRLMCCLRYEQEAYEDLLKRAPKTGAYVETEDGYGCVQQVNLLRQMVKVRMDGAGEAVVHNYSVEDIAEVPGGRPPEGEQPPHVLQPRPKKEEVAEEADDEWAMPPLFAEETAGERTEEASAAAGSESRSARRRSNRGGKRRSGGEKKNAAPAAEKKSGEKSAAPEKRSGEKKSGSARRSGGEKKNAPREGAAPAASGGDKSHRPRRSRPNRPRKSDNGGKE